MLQPREGASERDLTVVYNTLSSLEKWVGIICQPPCPAQELISEQSNQTGPQQTGGDGSSHNRR